MSQLPLQNQNLPRKPPVRLYDQGKISSLLMGSVTSGVVISDLTSTIYFVMLVLLAGMICAALRFYHRALSGFVALAVTAFSLGGLATEIEQWRLTKPLITAQADLWISADVIGFEDVHNDKTGRRVKFWLTNMQDETGATLTSDIIRLVADQVPDKRIQIGDQLAGSVRLYPLSPPLFPNWPDYARKSWSDGIVGTAYGIAPRLISQPKGKTDFGLITRLRQKIAHQIETDFPNNQQTTSDQQKLAKALLIGERDLSDAAFYDVFRKAGLALLLALSGLHMGLFCFDVYGVIRVILALFSGLSKQIAIHKGAVIIAVVSGLFYLLLADIPISALRAYAMACLILFAVLTDRHALSLRNLNIVFVAFIIASPSLLYQPAFQLSFAATYGIVFYVNFARQNAILSARVPVISATVTIALTSALASAATLLYVAYHFGVVTIWSVPANVVAIPLTAFFIMPMAVIYLILAMIDASFLIVWPFSAALSGLLYLAQWVSLLPYTDIWVSKPPQIYLWVMPVVLLSAYHSQRLMRYGALLFLIILGVAWYGQGVPIGVLTKTGKGWDIAIKAEATLYHSHHLSAFWQSSYQKILGHFDSKIRQSCRYNCLIKYNNNTIILHNKGERKKICGYDNLVIISETDPVCERARFIPLPPSAESAYLYHKDDGVFIITPSPDYDLAKPWRAKIK